jgi:uncharacterized protein (UPF0332 family)
LGETVSPVLRKLLEERRILRSRTSSRMVAKELKGSELDLATAKASYEAGDHKWATVQAYYSIFHAARALLYNRGFRERSHRGLLRALAELYPRNTLSDMLVVFEESMSLRENADYGLVYSEHGAGEALENAEVFFETSRMILHGSIGGRPPARVPGEDLLSYLEKSKASRHRISKRTHKHQASRGRRQRP